jgi:hypothetical protein
MRLAVEKVMWIGRATVFTVGLAVTLALMLGVATVALAAVPGDPFKLGKVNIISNAVTQLQGTAPNGGALLGLVRTSGIGPVLNVENKGIGGATRGIDINVPAGQPPILVNSTAGKAGGLNADSLDGKTEEDFLSASRIYGVSQVDQNTSGGDTMLFLLRCDDGDVAISGGGNAINDNDAINDHFPAPGSYQISFKDNEPRGSKFRGIIFCSDSSKPFKN